jgi:hypothetical protein
VSALPDGAGTQPAASISTNTNMVMVLSKVFMYAPLTGGLFSRL